MSDAFDSVLVPDFSYTRELFDRPCAFPEDDRQSLQEVASKCPLSLLNEQPELSEELRYNFVTTLQELNLSLADSAYDEINDDFLETEGSFSDFVSLRNYGVLFDAIMDENTTLSPTAKGLKEMHALLINGLVSPEKLLDTRQDSSPVEFVDFLYAPPAPDEIENLLETVFKRAAHVADPYNRALTLFKGVLTVSPFTDNNLESALGLFLLSLKTDGLLPLFPNHFASDEPDGTTAELFDALFEEDFGSDSEGGGFSAYFLDCADGLLEMLTADDGDDAD